MLGCRPHKNPQAYPATTLPTQPLFFSFWKEIYYIFLSFMWTWKWVHVCHGAHVQIRAQLSGVISPLQSFGSQGSNSGHQAWWFLPVSFFLSKRNRGMKDLNSLQVVIESVLGRASFQSYAVSESILMMPPWLPSERPPELTTAFPCVYISATNECRNGHRNNLLFE